jgi:hypothetical protein
MGKWRVIVMILCIITSYTGHASDNSDTKEVGYRVIEKELSRQLTSPNRREVVKIRQQKKARQTVLEVFKPLVSAQIDDS